MAEPLVKLRLPGTILLLILLAFLVIAQREMQAGLKDVAIYSGWTLAALSLFLASYNLRKKVSSLPIGRAWFWRRAHSFLGWLALAVFLIHAGVLPPNGWLHLLMWLLYVLVLLSGVAGLWLTLSVPPRIAAGGERIQFERIAHLREALYRRAEQVILSAATDGIGQPLLELHDRHLRNYLGHTSEAIRHCLNIPKKAQQLLRELNNIGRYVDSASQHYVDELEEIISNKHILDRQFALQILLKKWTYVHVAFNYLGWAFILIHIFTIYTFRLGYGL